MKQDIPNWAQWLAQDADGHWWAYEAEPHQHDSGWYENEIGKIIRLHKQPANKQWRESLQKITSSTLLPGRDT